jgi:glycosyltransferase involved in cell wall biosynthesis
MSPSPTASSFEERNDVLFVGAMYDRGSPNADSILWFCREIWPVVLSGLNGQSRPNLAIVGPNRVQEISELAGEQIKVWGQQPSLRHFYEQARVFIAPTRFAAGLPWKVGEAAAHGVPVVASGLVARQLGWTHEKQLLVAETPEEFAHCCLRLLSDKDLWLDIRTRALQAVEEEYGEANFNSVIAAELAQTEDSFATTASRLSVA